MAMLRGWRRQRANLIFAPLAMRLPLLPADLPFPRSPLIVTVRVSLTHNSHALFIPPSRSPVIYAGRRPCFSISSTLAYFVQSVHTTGCALSVSPSPPLSLSRIASLNNPTNLKVCYKLSLRRGVNSLKRFAIEYS